MIRRPEFLLSFLLSYRKVGPHVAPFLCLCANHERATQARTNPHLVRTARASHVADAHNSRCQRLLAEQTRPVVLQPAMTAMRH